MVANELTVSISKGKTTESSTAHNNRKASLKNATKDKIKKFYEQAGHTHIHKNYTKLNEDYIKDPKKMYNQLFEKSILEYNNKQKRKDRKIGKGLALTVKEKKGKIALLTMVHDYKTIKSKTKRKAFLAKLSKIAPKTGDILKKSLPNFEKLTLNDTKKMLTQAKHAKTLGEALYDKQKHSKQASTHVEFIFQIGSAKDFNEVDKNGRIGKSYDRKDPKGIWQKSKKVLKIYEKQFEKRNPNLKVINYSIHMDESTPHMHLEAIPVAETAKTLARGKKHKGLSIKPSFDGALECEGYKRDPHDSRKAFTAWQHDQAATLAKVMQKELGTTRKKGITNRLKNVHEYKYVKEEMAKQRETAHTYKNIANKNYDIYQNNAIAVKIEQKKLSVVTKKGLEAQKTLSNVSKERQNQLDALTHEIAQKRSKRLRELSMEMEENRKQEEKKLKAREDTVKQHEKAVKQHEKALSKREADVQAIQFGGYDSKGTKHKSIEQRVKDGIDHGIKVAKKRLFKIFTYPIKAFTYAYRKSMIKQQHPGYTKDQVKRTVNLQEDFLAHKAGGDRTQILFELTSAKLSKQSTKAIRAGTKELAKTLPSYQNVDEIINDSTSLEEAERLDKQQQQQYKQQQQQPKHKDKDDSPDFDF